MGWVLDKNRNCTNTKMTVRNNKTRKESGAAACGETRRYRAVSVSMYKKRRCTNCKNRENRYFDDIIPCRGYEYVGSEEEDVATAAACSRYEEEEERDKEEHYTPSACAGDYSPNTPWDAPGMSISDFI